MAKKIKFIFILIMILCILFATMVLATEVNANNIAPMTGNEIDTGEGYQNVIPISGELGDEGMLPITDDMPKWEIPKQDEDEETEEIAEETVKDHYLILYIVGGAAILTILVLVILIIKKK